jgi:ribose/xylose/arabinose/galactoside ABC-type transport system permease subunit
VHWWTSLVWPVTGLALLLLFNLAFTEGFFRVEIRDGRLYGVLIDILNHGSKVMLLSLGMALVIATSGVDLSVGAVMAITGAVAAQLINTEGIPFPVVIGASLCVALVAGAWNGLLVGAFNVQPIVATLILMVAGRGIAQLITGGQIITFTDPLLTYVGNGSLLGLPFPVLMSLAMLGVTLLLTRKTAIGLFIETVGDNQRASFYAGVNGASVKFFVYVFSGFFVRVWRDWWLPQTSNAQTQITPAYSWSWMPSLPWSSEALRSRGADSIWLVHLLVLFSFKRSPRRCTCAMSVPMSLRFRRLLRSWQFACFNPRPFVAKRSAYSAEKPHENTGLFEIHLAPRDRTGADCPLHGRLPIFSELRFAARGSKPRR